MLGTPRRTPGLEGPLGGYTRTIACPKFYSKVEENLRVCVEERRKEEQSLSIAIDLTVCTHVPVCKNNLHMYPSQRRDGWDGVVIYWIPASEAKSLFCQAAKKPSSRRPPRGLCGHIHPRRFTAAKRPQLFKLQ